MELGDPRFCYDPVQSQHYAPAKEQPQHLLWQARSQRCPEKEKNNTGVQILCAL